MPKTKSLTDRMGLEQMALDAGMMTRLNSDEDSWVASGTGNGYVTQFELEQFALRVACRMRDRCAAVVRQHYRHPLFATNSEWDRSYRQNMEELAREVQSTPVDGS